MTKYKYECNKCGFTWFTYLQPCKCPKCESKNTYQSLILYDN